MELSIKTLTTISSSKLTKDIVGMGIRDNLTMVLILSSLRTTLPIVRPLTCKMDQLKITFNIRMA